MGNDEDYTMILSKDEQPCYEISHCPKLGRHLVASRNIKKGEVILTDKPLVSGPTKESTILICPGCYQEEPEANCGLCGWPMCSENCPKRTIHDDAECKLIRNGTKDANDTKTKGSCSWEKLSDSLMLVRCLLLKLEDKRKWKCLMEMEKNWESWSESPLYSSAKEMETFIRSYFCLPEEQFSSLDILSVQAILDINSYEIRLPNSSSNIQAAYQLASLAEHSCLPNTIRTVCSTTMEVTFRAASDIPQGSNISTSYCDILWQTSQRQQYLLWSKFFLCSCPRCESPTELDSHLGSLICMNCFNRNPDSTTVPVAQPLLTENFQQRNHRQYQCTACMAIYPVRESHLVLKRAEEELSELDKYASFETLSTFEEWLNKWTLVEQIFPSMEEPSSDHNQRQVDDRWMRVDSEKTGIPESSKTTSTTTSTGYTMGNGNNGKLLLLHPQHSFVLDCCHTLFLLYPKEASCRLELAQLVKKERLGMHLLTATKSLFAGISKFRGTIFYELAMTKAARLAHQLESGGSGGIGNGNEGGGDEVTANLQRQLLAEEILQLLADSQEMLKYEPLDQPEGALWQMGSTQLEQLTGYFAQLLNTKHEDANDDN